MNDDNSFGKIIVAVGIVAIFYYGYGLLFSDNAASDYNESSSYSSESKNRKNCQPTENPYSQDSGHYAGFQWGESGKSCGGNSSSFIEGCEEYVSQEERYNQCNN